MTDVHGNRSVGGRLYGGSEFAVHRQGSAALALRLAGASYSEVAEALTLASADEARKAVEGTLANQVAASPDDVKLLREEESLRLLRLLRSVWTKATDGSDPEHLNAVKVAVQIVDRHTKLNGLDLPTQVQISSPAQAELEQWVASALTLKSDDLTALEASVIDVE